MFQRGNKSSEIRKTEKIGFGMTLDERVDFRLIEVKNRNGFIEISCQIPGQTRPHHTGSNHTDGTYLYRVVLVFRFSHLQPLFRPHPYGLGIILNLINALCIDIKSLYLFNCVT